VKKHTLWLVLDMHHDGMADSTAEIYHSEDVANDRRAYLAKTDTLGAKYVVIEIKPVRE